VSTIAILPIPLEEEEELLTRPPTSFLHTTLLRILPRPLEEEEELLPIPLSPRPPTSFPHTEEDKDTVFLTQRRTKT
jgi:hypothetical protein